ARHGETHLRSGRRGSPERLARRKAASLHRQPIWSHRTDGPRHGQRRGVGGTVRYDGLPTANREAATHRQGRDRWKTDDREDLSPGNRGSVSRPGRQLASLAARTQPLLLRWGHRVDHPGRQLPVVRLPWAGVQSGVTGYYREGRTDPGGDGGVGTL